MKYRGRKIIMYSTFYHDYHKMYFTTRTTTEYNKLRQILAVTVNDTHFKHIEKIMTYSYEYY